MNGKEILKDIINSFNIEKFEQFFRIKNNKLIFPKKSIDWVEEENNFVEGKKLAEGTLNDGEIGIYSFKVLNPLSERSAKKAQYELGKKILKFEQKDAGIFIFYDNSSNFRFSLIYTNYLGRERKWSNFRRFTYFVSKELTNKTFIQRIGEGDLSNLEKIKDAFSVDKVTKEFYQEIANWYFWAIKESKFPPDVEKEENGRNIAIIRLITRIIFIWFMKVRNLIPDELFKLDTIKEILKDVSDNEGTYYKAILQNLFFATLNTKQKERKFRSEIRGYKGYNTDFGNQNVYRYHNLFKDPEKMQEYFGSIPFLNGGLFDCLDYKSKKKEERFYIDGFTDTKQYQPYVPNFLFFSEERNVDLNKEYGTEGKKYKVRGLINILSSYNFTIDENEPDDLEVALDPELLGKVFENLLASYNPETATTARKASGSYYTPREIVDYMVTQSLINYFKFHLSDISDIDTKLSELFSKENTNNPFDEITTKKIISLIENLRVVDPAVGSGAFPMGILNKLVFILSKIDPENKFWEQAQIEAINRDVKDPILKEKLIEQAKEHFRQKDINYLRKLYLIEKCIYGVDIQQIAVEIAKLRFFISLLVDEKIDKTKENYGILPLPNLDFKLMQGNSLISSFAGIDLVSKGMSKDKEQFSLGFTTKYDELIKKFEDVKNQYQNEPDKDKKDKLREKIEELVLQIFEEKLNEYLPEFRKIKELATQIPNPEHRQKYIFSEKQKLAKKLGFDLEKVQKELIAYTEGRKPKNFFLWDVYFAEVFTGENPGFDIVIGNPPYIRQEKIKSLKPLFQSQNYEVFDSTSDIYPYFYEKGWQILKLDGILCFISSNKWMRAKYGEKLRKFFKEKTTLKQIIDFNGYKVFTSTVDTNILLFQKTKPDNNIVSVLNVKPDFTKDTEISTYFQNNILKIKQSVLDTQCFTFADEKVMNLKSKIEKIGTPLKNWDVKIYRGVLTGFNEAFIIDSKKREEILNNCKDKDERKRTEEILKPILRGRDIGRYYYKWAGLWVIKIESGWTNKNRKGQNPEKFFKETFPTIYNQLISFKNFKAKGKGLINRDDQGDYWWELRDCDYYHEFEKEKIVWNRITNSVIFSFVDKEYYVLDSTFFITGRDLKYIVAILNSKLSLFWMKNTLATLGEGMYGAKIYVEQLPIQKISEPEQKPFIDLVDKILAITKDADYLDNPQKQAKVKELEKEIDKLVYKLYNLTEEEIKIVESSL